MKIVLFLIALAAAATHFSEDFSSGWEKRWVQSESKPEAERGQLVSDESGGVKTATDARFYQYSAKFTPFSNKGKDLVLQFSVANRQNIDCGGAYWKLLPAVDQSKFNGDSDYSIMFGPDICGSTKRTHAIITHKGKNHLIKKDLNVQTDKLTHVYTFVIHADHKTFDVLVDNVSERSGQITDEWDILPPKKINDPAASKPADWVDTPKMDDPTDIKPAGYDDIPAQIADPEASKPGDWDDDLDGKWTAPLIDNPEYKGEWKAKQIDNPAYKGPWVHPQIDNPDFKEDNTIADFSAIAAIGMEVWQVKSGTVFDNLLVTDSIEEAKKAAEAILVVQKAEKAEEEKKEAEEKKAAEAAAEKAKAEEEAKKGAEEATQAKDEL